MLNDLDIEDHCRKSLILKAYVPNEALGGNIGNLANGNAPSTPNPANAPLTPKVVVKEENRPLPGLEDPMDERELLMDDNLNQHQLQEYQKLVQTAQGEDIV
jgi:hypothetical protein